jgi:hypothetical protein
VPLVAPGSFCWSDSRSLTLCTASRIRLITFGWRSSVMSMMRAAPTLLCGLYWRTLELNSSNSTRYLRPLMVTGMTFCGMLISGQVMRAISGTLAFGLLMVRFWIFEMSRMMRPPVRLSVP